MPADHDSATMLYLQDRAATYQLYQGNFSTAITVFEQVLADRERLLGPEHLYTLIARGNLAASYRHAGRTNDAIPIQERVLAESERILGPQHPDTLAAIDALRTLKS